MRARTISIIVALGVAYGGGTAIACQSDGDCDPGSHCVIQDGRADGVCVNDAPAPGVDEQQTIETPPVDDTPDDGATCQTHQDCGVGGRCVKQPGATTGVCAGGM